VAMIRRLTSGRRANRSFRPGLRYADGLAQAAMPRAALAFAITYSTGSLGQRDRRNTIESQNLERSRSSIGETLARQTGSGLSAA
jgi:hypothetical protein